MQKIRVCLNMTIENYPDIRTPPVNKYLGSDSERKKFLSNSGRKVDPFCMVVTGPTKIGKTTALLYAYVNRAMLGYKCLLIVENHKQIPMYKTYINNMVSAMSAEYPGLESSVHPLFSNVHHADSRYITSEVYDIAFVDDYIQFDTGQLQTALELFDRNSIINQVVATSTTYDPRRLNLETARLPMNYSKDVSRVSMQGTNYKLIWKMLDD